MKIRQNHYGVVALWLLCATPVAAQPIHGAPQGVTAYTSTLDRPWVTGQCHWKDTGPDPNPVGPLVPGITHTHIEAYPPIWAELGPGPVTMAFTLRLFKTPGKLTGLIGEFLGPYGPVPMSEVVTDTPLPLVGDPEGLVSMTGHVTFDPALATLPVTWPDGHVSVQRDIPEHGWFNTRLWVRTEFDNHDMLDTQLAIPFFSVLNPAMPEPLYGEGTMQFAAFCSIQSPDVEKVENGGFGAHVTEIRGTDGQARGFVPILSQSNDPFTVFTETYNYKALPTLFPAYELRLDPNFHMGIAGTLLATKSVDIPNGVSNTDVLDPVVIAASVAPMGGTPGKHRIFAIWDQDTKSGSPGFAKNERLVSLLGFEVAIGPNPHPAPPPIVTPPPVIVPPPIVPVVPTIFEFTCDNSIQKVCTLVIR